MFKNKTIFMGNVLFSYAYFHTWIFINCTRLEWKSGSTYCLLENYKIVGKILKWLLKTVLLYFNLPILYDKKKINIIICLIQYKKFTKKKKTIVFIVDQNYVSSIHEHRVP